MAINYNEEEFGLQVPNNNQGIMEVADAYTTPTAGDYGFSLIELDRLKRGGYNPGEVSNWENKEDVQSLIRSLEPTAMAISNYDEVFGPKRMTDAFGTTHTLAAANKPDLYTGTMDTTTGQPTGTIDVGFQNALRDAAMAEQLQANQLNQDYGQFFRNRPVNERNFMSPIKEGIGSFKTNVGQKVGQGWDFAQQLPGMAMSALSGIPGIGMAMGLLRNMARPDSPYQAFQKQTFKDMGWQGESNKDPWGKNIRSWKDNYDVRDQWGDLMGTKLGQNYGYEQAFADGVITDAEIEAMMGEGLAGGDYKGTGKFKGGLKGWQLNRLIGLSDAAKKAQAWKDKKAAEKILTNKMKNIDTGGGKTTTYTPPTKQGTTGSWTPGGTYTGGGAGWSPAGKSPSSSGYSRGSYGGRGHHWAKGGRVGYANGGLASLFTRRG